MGRDEIQQAVWRKEYLTFSFLHLVGFLIPFICQVLAFFPLFLLDQASRAVVKA